MKTQNSTPTSKQALLTMIFVLSTLCLASAQMVRTAEDGVPTGKGWAVAGDMSRVISLSKLQGSKPAATNGIVYHGGPVISASVN
ncbi:MAG: hypothetical protein ACREP9_16185, partial [Candidatus Dormibacteraceae bacterium]